MRPNTPTSLFAALVVALAAAPVAASPQNARERGEPFPRIRLAPAEAAAASRAGQGPVHPLAGRPDYGSAQNAFGARSGRGHDGQDVFAPVGTPLVAVTDSIVIEAGTDGAAGNHVLLYDARAERTYIYMHMVRPPSVRPGERARTGQRLGGVGCTGSCWGDHLHFEVREGRGWDAEPVDPLPLLRDWPRARGPN